MATSGELIKLFARTLKLPEVTVGIYYRKLRENGLVTIGGRGRSAASLTFLDASRLLIALMASDTAVEVAAKTRKYGRLPLARFKPGSPRDGYPGLTIEHFRSLNFESAVDHILGAVALSAGHAPVTDELNPLTISARSDTTAHIDFLFRATYDNFPSDWTKAETGGSISPSRVSHNEQMPKGLRVERTVGGEALVAIARLIMPGKYR